MNNTDRIVLLSAAAVLLAWSGSTYLSKTRGRGHSDDPSRRRRLSTPYFDPRTMEPRNSDPRLSPRDDQNHLNTDGRAAVTSSSSPRRSFPRYIFGHTTGHSGSGTVQSALSQVDGGCPWNHAVDGFEKIAEDEKSWPYDGDCSLTATKLVPTINDLVDRSLNRFHKSPEETAYVDLGHYHNRGQTLQCMARHYGPESLFVRLRRSRYSVAQSYNKKKTPCIVDYEMYGTYHRNKPVVSVCPRSGEGAGPVNLPVDDATWDAFTPFQRFLWYADEMEHRWHTLTAEFDGRQDSPGFYEISWNTGSELLSKTEELRSALGCAPLDSYTNTRKHPHAPHGMRRACSDQVRQDLEYRRRMGFSPETYGVLYRNPQWINVGECMEGREELAVNIVQYCDNNGIPYDEREWILYEKDDGMDFVVE